MSIVKNLKFKKVEGFDPHKFAQMLEDAYISTARDGKNTKKSTFSPSTVGYGHGNCPRYWFIAFNGADFDETKDPGAIANMLNGTYAHDRIQKMMEKTGTVKHLEKEIKYDDPPIRGFVDAVIEWEGKDIVGEIKTAKSETFDVKAASNKPSGNHRIQILMYMKVLEIDEGFVMYENKNTQEICVIPISMNENNKKFIEEVFEWMRGVYAAYEANTLPTRTNTKSSYQCKGCPVRAKCWKELGDGDTEMEALVVPK